MRLFFLALCLWIGVSTTVSMPTHASSLSPEQRREARHRGDIKPLRWVLRQIHHQYPGRVLDVDLDRHHHQYIYKIRLLQQGGYVLKLYVDARTAEVLKVKSRKAQRK